MFYAGNDAELGPGMVFFAHMILMDADSGNAMCPGRSYIIGEDHQILMMAEGGLAITSHQKLAKRYFEMLHDQPEFDSADN